MQEILAKITWYHNVILMDKIKDIEEKKWYISQTIKNGWSTNVLKNQIKNKLYISYYKIYLNICKVNYQKQKK